MYFKGRSRVSQSDRGGFLDFAGENLVDSAMVTVLARHLIFDRRG